MPKESNVVYIGRKPPMSYVTAIITSFTRSNTEAVTLKARGRAITTAVDAAEITRRRFLRDVNVGRITVGTEALQQEEGGTRNVSTMEITLTRGPVEKKTAKGIEETEAATPARTELTSIAGIGEKRAEALKAYGVTNLQDLANSDPKALSEKLQISEKRVLKWIDEAKENLKR